MTSGRGRLPYPGLRAFNRDEADLFFGRDGAVDAMLGTLARTGFLAVIGASGTGKSSLVRTGLLDGLELGLHPWGADWRFAIFMPGGDPLANLARSLCALEAEETGDDPGDGPFDPAVLIEGQLRQGPSAIREWRRSSPIPQDVNVLILVDQFEELFRFAGYSEREDAEAFVRLLVDAATQPDARVQVVITMRSEFLGACALIPGLAEILNRGTYLTPRMGREECREAMLGPARIVGATLEPALVTRLLNDLEQFAPWGRDKGDDQLRSLSRRADQLPVMQHILNRMWKQARPGPDGGVTLTLAEYEALGGISGALDAHGAEVLASLDGPRRTLAERIFRALVDGTTPASATRRPMTLAELGAETGATVDEVAAIIEPFRDSDCNFLRPGPGEPLAPDTVIDISHESLIRQWSTLSEWVSAEARAAALWRRLENAADRYERGEDDLLGGLALANLASWWRDDAPGAHWARRYSRDHDRVAAFMAASEAAEANRAAEAAARERSDRRRLQRWLAGVSALALAAVGAAGWGYLNWREANENQLVARQNLERAGQAVDRLAVGLVDRLENQLRLPAEKEIGLIRDTDDVVTEISAGRPDSELLQKRAEFLMRSVRVLLAGGAVDEAARYGQALADLLDEADRGDWSPPSALRAQAEMDLARLARRSTRFDEAEALLSTLETRLGSMAQAGEPDADTIALLAELLDERLQSARSRYRYDSALDHYDTLRAHLSEGRQRIRQERERAGDEGTYTEQERRLLLAAIRSGIEVIKIYELLDLDERREGKSEDLIEEVQGYLGILVEIGDAGDPQTGILEARLAAAEANKLARIAPLDISAAYDKIGPAISALQQLAIDDPGNLAARGHLVVMLTASAGYASDLGLSQQAAKDVEAARALYSQLVRNGADDFLLFEGAAAIAFRDGLLASEADASAATVAHMRYSSLIDRHADQNGFGTRTLDHRVGIAWCALGSRLIERWGAQEVAALADSALAAFELTGLSGADRYYALKMRNYVFMRMADVPVGKLGAVLWKGYLDGYTANLSELAKFSQTISNSRLAYAHGQAAAALGDAGRHDLKIHHNVLALQNSVSVLLAEPENLQVFQNALIYARELLEAVAATGEWQTASRAFSDHLVPVLPASRALWSDAEAHANELIREGEKARDRLREEGDAEGASTVDALLREIRSERHRPGPTSDEAPSGTPSPGTEDARKKSATPVFAGPATMPDLRTLDIDEAERLRGIGWEYEPVYQGPWRTLLGPERKTMQNMLSGALPRGESDEIRYIRGVNLPFYDDGALVEVQLERPVEAGDRAEFLRRVKAFLIVNGVPYLLDGRSNNIHQANADGPIRLTDASSASAYLRFFTTYVNGDEGAFQLVEHLGDISWRGSPPLAQLQSAKGALRPFVLWEEPEGSGTWKATGAVHYASQIFHSKFTLPAHGIPEMVGDQPATEALDTRWISIADRARGEGIRMLGFPAPSGAVDGVAVSRLDHSRLAVPEMSAIVTELTETVVDYAQGATLPAWAVALLSDPIVRGGMDADRLNEIAYSLAQNDLELPLALAIADEAVAAAPENAVIAETLGFALYKSGEPERALEVLEPLQDRIPENAELWLHLAQAHRATGAIDDARQSLDRAEEFAGQAGDVAEAVARERELLEAGGPSGTSTARDGRP